MQENDSNIIGVIAHPILFQKVVKCTCIAKTQTHSYVVSIWQALSQYSV